MPFAELSSSFSIEHVRWLCDFSIHTQLAFPWLSPSLFGLLGFSLFSVRFVSSPAIFINKFACQMTLFMVFLYERHTHIYLDPRPSSFCHTLLTSLLKYVYMLKLVFCLCHRLSLALSLSCFVCLPVKSWQTKWIRNWVLALFPLLYLCLPHSPAPLLAISISYSNAVVSFLCSLDLQLYLCILHTTYC